MKTFVGFAFLAMLAMTMGIPVVVKENIRDQIISVHDNVIFASRNKLNGVLRQTFSATRKTSGGIVRASLGFLRVSRSGSSFTIPGTPGVTFSATLEGSVVFDGYLASSVESTVDTLAQQISSEFHSFYRRERKNLQTRAGVNYYSFFQAAASYGYSDDKETRDIVSSRDFQTFSERTRSALRSSEVQKLTANYDTMFSGVSPGGQTELIQANAYIRISQITLDSGELLTLVRDTSNLVVADQNGGKVGEVKDGAKIERENINDSNTVTVVDRMLTN